MRTAAREHSAETREFLLALLVAFVTMIVVVVATLYLLGTFSSASQPSAVITSSTNGPRIYTAEDLTPAPRPTAVWKFRSEWQKPEP